MGDHLSFDQKKIKLNFKFQQTFNMMANSFVKIKYLSGFGNGLR